MKIALSRFLNEYADVNEDILAQMIAKHTDQFDRNKLEKDFYLTILLIHIGKIYPELIFKGWTCLNKIYYDYYRLSEDLDFVVIQDTSRPRRKQLLERYKVDFQSDFYHSLWLSFVDQRTKFNEDRQWCFEFTYHSLFNNSLQTIKIDIRIEPALLLPPVEKEIWSIFIDPFSWQKFFHHHTIKVMDLQEIFAEKTRAALTRDPSAIRDFFDIRYAREQGFDFELIRPLIQQKVADLPFTIPDTPDELKQKIATELNPVLSKQHREAFDLPSIHAFILSLKP